MIAGIGADVIEIERIEKVLVRAKERFLARVLTDSERAEATVHLDLPRFVAKRWAAKEALAKALGLGVRPPVTFLAMSVAHDSLGRPFFQFQDELANYLLARGIVEVHLSITDERLLALAFVVLECPSKN